MNAEPDSELAEFLVGVADDELILAHRNSEWTGHAPILEEDIAFTNIALDEMGHAQLWYRLVAELRGEDPDAYPDQLVFYRQAPEFRNVQMMELPKGDWAFTLLRQYLFDAFESVRLARWTESSHQGLRETAAKIRGEEMYHLRHTEAWVRRLGLGTEESHQRMQRALESLWGYALQLFEPGASEPALVETGLVPASEELREAWLEHVVPQLEDANLEPPKSEEPEVTERTQHSEYMVELLSDLQQVARTFPEVEW
ncbi:MAG: 1,2-phenylacetyl-CoA epoxidase subunit PaaC [Anaerolineales bacterium]|nr:1,2-phenylacetyl-CoA epoxidase subunit PaaC [Anaerolineales bacterium]